MDWNDTDPAFVIGNGTGTSDRSNAFEVRKDGQVSVNGGVVHASDKRLKENIEELPYGIEEILQLKPVTYNWKRYPENGRHIGLIAQEVKDVLPELVETGNSEQQYLHLDYTNIIPVLINGLKELKAENDELKARIEVLEAE